MITNACRNGSHHRCKSRQGASKSCACSCHENNGKMTGVQVGVEAHRRMTSKVDEIMRQKPRTMILLAETGDGRVITATVGAIIDVVTLHREASAVLEAEINKALQAPPNPTGETQ